MKVAGINTLKEYARLSGVQHVIQTKPQAIPVAKKAFCSYKKEPCIFYWGFPEEYKCRQVYDIDLLSSRGKGTGTAAIKSVLRESIADLESEGRVTLLAANIDASTPHPFLFYYKLGFRAADEYYNQFGEKGVTVPYSDAMVYMYLPKENIQKCLNYKNSFDEKSSGLRYLYNEKR